MNNTRSSVGIYGLGIILLLLIATLGWVNYRYISVYPTSKNFIIQWTAYRLFAREGFSPYSEQVAQEAERLVYGHLAQGDEERLRFSQPFYAGLFILPFSLISDFKMAWTLWLVIMEIILVVIALLGLRVTGYRPKGWVLGLILIFSVSGFHSFSALASGNLVILAAFWIALAFLAMRSGRLEVAGLLFSLATIYPKSMLLLGILLVIWSGSKRNWTVVFWYVVGIAFLSLISFFLLQDWFIQYFRLLWQMRNFSDSLTSGKVISYGMPGPGRQIGWGLAIFLGVILVSEWIAVRKKEFRWLFWTGSLTLTIGPWLGLPVELDDLVLLLLPLILILAVWEERFGKRSYWLAAALPLSLLLGLWLLYYRSIQAPIPQPSIDALIFPMPLLILIGLYWVRWWAIRPVRTYIEDLRSSHVL